MVSFKTYGEYLAEKFPGGKVQKISVNAGFSCPNRDGTIGRGGCIYCNNTAFTPAYAFGSEDVRRQLERGKEFFGRKYPDMRYLAYFQSFTNTFGGSAEELGALYRSAAEVDRVAGLIIGTRPDCMPDEVADILEEINRELPVIVEFGAESFCDRTLGVINRGHTSAQTEEAVRRLAKRGISVGLHLIFGLPGESRRDMLESVERAVSLPIDTIKFHHMQVIEGTPLADRYKAGELRVHPTPPENDAEPCDITLWDVESYLSFCHEVIAAVPTDIAIERFTASAPAPLLLAPRWGLKNYQFMNLLTRPT